MSALYIEESIRFSSQSTVFVVRRPFANTDPHPVLPTAVEFRVY